MNHYSGWMSFRRQQRRLNHRVLKIFLCAAMGGFVSTFSFCGLLVVDIDSSLKVRRKTIVGWVLRFKVACLLKRAVTQCIDGKVTKTKIITIKAPPFLR